MNKEFAIGDLFSWDNGNTDIKKEHINGKGIPVVSSGLENEGVIGCSDIDAKILPSNTITIDMFGNVFYRDFEYKEVTHARVFTLLPKNFNLDVPTGLYFVSSLKWLCKIYSYNNMCSYAKISDMTVSLPVIPSADPSHVYTPADIDWQYMRDRITELERDRITELERDRITELDAYLKATGLDDYELTEEDKKVLSSSKKSASDEDGAMDGDCRIRKKEFYLMHTQSHDGLFSGSRGTRLTKQNRKSGSIPLLTAGIGLGQGIAQNIVPVSGMCLYNEDITIDMFGEAFCHDYKHYGDDNIHFLVNDNIRFLSKLYICAVINKNTNGVYSYSKQFRMNILEDMQISLPVTSSGEPDWDYMEKYIRAMEKVVIADVVKWKDKEIEATKKIVG